MRILILFGLCGKTTTSSGMLCANVVYPAYLSKREVHSAIEDWPEKNQRCQPFKSLPYTGRFKPAKWPTPTGQQDVASKNSNKKSKKNNGNWLTIWIPGFLQKHKIHQNTAV